MLFSFDLECVTSFHALTLVWHFYRIELIRYVNNGKFLHCVICRFSLLDIPKNDK